MQILLVCMPFLLSKLVIPARTRRDGRIIPSSFSIATLYSFQTYARFSTPHLPYPSLMTLASIPKLSRYLLAGSKMQTPLGVWMPS